MFHLEFEITANSYRSDCNNKVMLALLLWNGEEPYPRVWGRKAGVLCLLGRLISMEEEGGEEKSFIWLCMKEKRLMLVWAGVLISRSATCWCSKRCDYVSPKNQDSGSCLLCGLGGAVPCGTPGRQACRNAWGCSHKCVFWKSACWKTSIVLNLVWKCYISWKSLCCCGCPKVGSAVCCRS